MTFSGCTDSLNPSILI